MGPNSNSTSGAKADVRAGHSQDSNIAGETKSARKVPACISKGKVLGKNCAAKQDAFIEAMEMTSEPEDGWARICSIKKESTSRNG